MTMRNAFSLLFFALVSGTCLAAEFDFKGKLFTQAGIGIPNGHNSSNQGDLLT